MLYDIFQVRVCLSYISYLKLKFTNYALHIHVYSHLKYVFKLCRHLITITFRQQLKTTSGLVWKLAWKRRLEGRLWSQDWPSQTETESDVDWKPTFITPKLGVDWVKPRFWSPRPSFPKRVRSVTKVKKSMNRGMHLWMNIGVLWLQCKT